MQIVDEIFLEKKYNSSKSQGWLIHLTADKDRREYCYYCNLENEKKTIIGNQNWFFVIVFLSI